DLFHHVRAGRGEEVAQRGGEDARLGQRRVGALGRSRLQFPDGVAVDLALDTFAVVLERLAQRLGERLFVAGRGGDDRSVGRAGRRGGDQGPAVFQRRDDLPANVYAGAVGVILQRLQNDFEQSGVFVDVTVEDRADRVEAVGHIPAKAEVRERVG